jgi:hypothetical protein
MATAVRFHNLDVVVARQLLVHDDGVPGCDR